MAASRILEFGLLLFIFTTCGGQSSVPDTALDPGDTGVCNKTISVTENVPIKVSFRAQRKTQTRTCLGPNWEWRLDCYMKTKTVYYIDYRQEFRPTVKQKTVMICCVGFVDGGGVCVPDCNRTDVDCSKNCTGCSGEYSFCNRITGICHCKPGHYRVHEGCEECPEGFYGRNCTRRCQCKGNNTSCAPQDGRCTCEPGKTGDICDQDCSPLNWGRGCSNFCNCSTFPCDPRNGNCRCGKDRAGTRCETAIFPNGTAAGRNSPEEGNDAEVTIPIVIVAVVIAVAVTTVVVIVVVIVLRKKKGKAKENPDKKQVERVNPVYSPDDVAQPSPFSREDNSNMLVENDIYQGCVEDDLNRMNFQGQFKTEQGQGEIYSTCDDRGQGQMTSDGGMVENDIYTS